jgi:hypothetical protein
VTQKDALGLASFVPAETHIDGSFVAPPHVLVEPYYGTEVPDAVHEKLRDVFPGAVVRNARLSSVAKPVPPKKKKETDTFEGPETDIDDPELRSDFSTDPKEHLKDPGRYLRSAQWAQETFLVLDEGIPPSWAKKALGWLRKPSGK